MILWWQSEVELFWRALLLGIALRALYDLCLIRRSFYRQGRRHLLLDGAEDLIYWLFCGVAIFTLMFHYNNGIPRGFLYLAIAAGMLLYHFGPSAYVVAGIHRILAFVGKILHKFIKKPLFHVGKRLQNHIKSIKIRRSEKRKERAAGEEKKKKKAARRK